MDDAIIRKYDRPVPRYTSYPAAPQFSPAVGPDRAAQWLGQVASDARASVYVHLPFCRQLCWFCGCHTTIPNDYGRVRDYLEVLEREAELVAGSASPEVVRLHWGGGTPTILTPGDIARLADALRRIFKVAPAAEFSVEIDPRGFTQERARALAAAGVTRVSLGVQDLTPEVQQAINRAQPVELTARVADWLRAAGVAAVNVDLMYGLPHQTVARVVRTAETAVLRLQPDRLAVFGYAHVPWMKKHQRMIADESLPDAVARFRQAEAIGDVLDAFGYVRVGLDHFARPGDPLARAAADRTLRRNFQGYTTDDAPVLIGLGASAIGTLPRGYVQNAPRLDHYVDAIAGGRLATARGVVLSEEDRLRRTAIERLMCDFRLDPAAVAMAHGRPRDHFRAAMERLAPLAADGLVELDDGRIVIPWRARPFVRLAAAAFDEYLEPSARRHARAV